MGRRWDAVVDTCGFVPRVVRASAELLSESVDHYTFVSTLNVYAEPGESRVDENSALASMEDETVEVIDGDTYGPLKALCEEAVTEAMAAGTANGRALLVRSGLIVGPYDPSDRFTYWPHRVAAGGEVLAPGEPMAPVQFVDVRDIARWVIQAVEAGLTGPYNVTGPDYSLTMETFLDSCRQVSGSGATFTWVSEEFLLENEVAAYTEMPLWLPADSSGLATVNCGKAVGGGLVFRPLAETIADTLQWQASRPQDYKWRAGMASEREAMLLHEWHAVR
jgi:2'-hydroxyisoflavone reductase